MTITLPTGDQPLHSQHPDSQHLGRTLLGRTDPHPVHVQGDKGPSPLCLVSDHAGRAIPAALGTLGLSEADRARHIAYDIGIRAVGRALQARIGAPLIEQCYSRLVIDCNRAPGHPTSIPIVSDHTVIPGNDAVSPEERRARESLIFEPYHDAIARVLEARSTRATALIALHSFTPSMNGLDRPWQAGVLFNREARLARTMADLLRAEGLYVGENEPYVLTDFSDYTVPHHAEKRHLPYIELEIRQDLIGDREGQDLWAERLSRLLPRAWEIFRT